MLKVGVPAWIDESLLATFPEGVAVERIPSKPEQAIEVQFLIAHSNLAAMRETLPQLRGLKVIQAMMAGVDWLRPLVPEGVTLCDGQGLHNIPTAEWTVTAILSSLKFFPFYRDLQHTGQWQRASEVDGIYRTLDPGPHPAKFKVLQDELHGKRVLIVGYGSIGRSIEERLLPFGVDIVRMARSAREGVEPIAKLHDLLPEVDIVVLIVPLTEETTGLIGEAELGLMKQGALLVNAARGPVVKTDALLAALEAGRIRAAIDVTDPEPLPEGHPLWSAPNLLITPHVAGSSPHFAARAVDLAAAQVRRYLKGEPLENVVTGSY